MKKIKKLELKRETVRNLQVNDLGKLNGGTGTPAMPFLTPYCKVASEILESLERFSPASEATVHEISNSLAQSIKEASQAVSQFVSANFCMSNQRPQSCASVQGTSTSMLQSGGTGCGRWI